MTLLGSSQSILSEDPNWTYTDSPWDLFRDCQYWASGAHNASIYQGACILSHILGFVSAYIFPFVGLVGIVSNIFVSYVFLFVFRKPSRQMIYLACVSVADVLTIIIVGWILMFPSKGLPYATGAHIYFFIFNVNNYSCKIVRYLQSFSSCASSSLLLLTALDRCLCIYFPLKFARISRRRAWEAVGVTALFSALIMLPFGIKVGHRLSNGKIVCLVHADAEVVQTIQILFSNSSPIQIILVIIVNIALLIRLRQSAVLRETMSKCTSAKREIASSMLLVILSTIVVICALPQSISFTVSMILSKTLEGETDRMAVRMAYNICDLGWQLLFIQQASNWVLYLKRMKNFRRTTFHLLRCHCRLGRNLVEDAFESIHYLSTKARNLTSETHFTRDIPKVYGGPQFLTSKKGGVTDFRKVDDTGALSTNKTSNYGSNIKTPEICRYTYRGSMRNTATMSTISPGTIYANFDSSTDASPLDTGKIVTRF